MNCIYEIPVILTAESNNTFIQKKVFKILDCVNDNAGQEACQLWAYTKCNSDSDYCQPFVKGDIIYRQFISPREYYTFKFFHLVDSVSGVDIPISGIVTFEVGYDADDNEYTNVIIDTTNLNSECFYFYFSTFKVNVKDPEKFEEYEQCVADLILDGVPESEASELCANNIYSDFRERFYSEPYCLIKCTGTIVLEGYYPSYDCNRNFYGTFTSGSATNSYKNRIRIAGEVDPNQINIESVKFNKKRKSTTILNSFLLRSKKLPYYMVQRLAVIFASKEIIVDGAVYEGAESMSKNIDEGKMWIIETTLTQECGETNFTCEK